MLLLLVDISLSLSLMHYTQVCVWFKWGPHLLYLYSIFHLNFSLTGWPQFTCEKRPCENLVKFILIFLEISRGSYWCYLVFLVTDRKHKWFQKPIIVSFEDWIRLAFPLEVGRICILGRLNSVINSCLSFSWFSYCLFAYVCIFKNLNFSVKYYLWLIEI